MSSCTHGSRLITILSDAGDKYALAHTRDRRILHISLQSIPITRMRLMVEPEPVTIRTLEVGTLRAAAIFSITALFALPSSGKAVTWHPIAFLQGLNPEGKQFCLLPVETSMVMTVPSFEGENAPEIPSGVIIRIVARH